MNDTTAMGEGPTSRADDTALLQLAVESTNQELAFYRRRSGQLYLVALTAEALLIVGREQIRLDDPLRPAGMAEHPAWAAPLILTVAFFAVAVVGTVLGAEYRHRIHELKDRRKALFVSRMGRTSIPSAIGAE